MAILAILFGLWYGEIAKALEVIPKTHSVDNVASRGNVSIVLFSKALPIAVMALAVAAIFLPDALHLTKESWNLFNEIGPDLFQKYDAVKTAYCFVTVLSIVLAAYMWALVFQLWSLRKRLS